MADQWEEAAKQFKPDPNAKVAPTAGGNDDWKLWQQNAPSGGVSEPGNHGLSEFITSPHGFIREGARQIGQGAKELFTPGQRMRGATDVLRGAGSVATPAMLGAGGAALAAAPLATVGAIGLGSAGSGLGSMAGKKLATVAGGGPEAQELAGEVGSTLGGIGAGYAGSKIAPALGAMVPSAERVGQKFQRVNEAVGKVPVDLTKASEPIFGAHQLERTGSGAPPAVITKLSERLPQHGGAPVPFEESRLFQSNAGRLSTAEQMAAKPQMQRQVSLLAKALADENARVAEEGGVGPLYQSAMNEYRRAMKLQGMKEGAADIAKKVAVRALLPAAGVGAGYYGARKLLGE